MVVNNKVYILLKGEPYHIIKTKAQIDEWLKDGSIESGDVIYEATLYAKAISTTTISLEVK